MASPTVPLLRRKVCYVVSICEIVCGSFTFVFAIVLQSLASRGHGLGAGILCQDYVGSAFTHGVCLLVVGAFGVISSKPASRFQASLGEKAFCVVHVKWSGYESAETIVLHVTVILKLIITYVGQVLAAVGAGFAIPDICPLSSNQYVITSNEKGSCLETKGTLSKPALQLPEARTHIQEAPGTGEKVTVVSLPHADGVVYAVPEDQYVVKRGECTYAAPTGNPRLTAFFPTYTKVQID